MGNMKSLKYIFASFVFFGLTTTSSATVVFDGYFGFSGVNQESKNWFSMNEHPDHSRDNNIAGRMGLQLGYRLDWPAWADSSMQVTGGLGIDMYTLPINLVTPNVFASVGLSVDSYVPFIQFAVGPVNGNWNDPDTSTGDSRELSYSGLAMMASTGFSVALQDNVSLFFAYQLSFYKMEGHGISLGAERFGDTYYQKSAYASSIIFGFKLPVY